MNRTSPLATLLPLLVLASAGLSCAEKSEQSTATSSVSQAVVTPSSSAAADGSTAERPHKHHPRAGLVGLFFQAADSLGDLSDSERATIAELEKKLGGDGGERAARQTLRSDIAAGVRAGTIDVSKVSADQAALEKIAASSRSARADALAGLHDALAPADRKTVADDVRAKLEERASRRPRPDAGAERGPNRRLEHLTAELKLDASQQQQVAAILTKGNHGEPSVRKEAWEAGKRRIDALLAEFAETSFDAGALPQAEAFPESQREAGAAPHDRAGHEVAFLQRLLPILTPEQRDELATSIEKPRGPEWRDPSQPPGDSPDDGDDAWH